MIINIFLDALNITIIIFLTIRLFSSYNKYDDGLQEIRKALLVGIFFAFISEALLATNTISNMMHRPTEDFVFGFWWARALLRIGILVGLLVFGGIADNSKFQFLKFQWWKDLYK